MYDNMFLRDRLPVNSSDKNRFKSAEDMLNENSRLIQAVAEPLANYFADWFFTKQLLRVTENHNNRTSLEQLLENNQIVRMRCIRYVTSTSGHECLYLLQSMLFIVLGIDMYGKNLSTYEFSTDDIAIAESLLNKLAEELNYLNQWHQLYFHLAQAKFLSITGNISKSIEYLEAAEALVHGYNECQTMMRCCLDTFIETLHAEDQRLGERTEKRATSKRGNIIKKNVTM